MNKWHVIVLALLLAVCGVLVFHRRHRTPLSIKDSGEIASQIIDNGAGKTDTFCALGSTVYLTQEQQEYKLGKRGKNTSDVKDVPS